MERLLPPHFYCNAKFNELSNPALAELKQKGGRGGGGGEASLASSLETQICKVRL